MQENDELLQVFEEQFKEIHDGAVPRPGLFGYSRVARQLHKVEATLADLIRMKDNPRYPRPKEPITGYERWLEQQEEDELSTLFGDIFQANPTLFDDN